MSEGLCANALIQKLDLAFNSIGPTGCKAICEAVTKKGGHSVVSHFDLTASAIQGPVGRAALQRLIGESGTTLLWLAVAENRLVAVRRGRCTVL
jgi:hypothetical protein